MRYRFACAAGLLVNAAVVLIGGLSEHMSPMPLSGLDIPRAILSVVLAAGLLLRVRAFQRLAAAYVVWFGTWGALFIFGSLYQFLVPSGGMTIIPDKVRSGVALASEMALFAAAIALRRDTVRSA